MCGCCLASCRCFVLSQFEAPCAIAKRLFQALWHLDFASNLGAQCKTCAVQAPETGRGASKFPANTAWEGFMKPNIYRCVCATEDRWGDCVWELSDCSWGWVPQIQGWHMYGLFYLSCQGTAACAEPSGTLLSTGAPIHEGFQ